MDETHRHAAGNVAARIRVAAPVRCAARPLRRRIGAACVAVALAAPALADDPPSKPRELFPVDAGSDLPDAAATFEEVRRLIRERYYTDSITDEALYNAAIRGMLRHVSPPHDPERARIWQPAEYARVAETLQGVSLSSGVKSTYNPAESALTVSSIDPGSPAAGQLRPHDRIVRINGKRLTGLTGTQIDAMLHGEPGDAISLTVVRDVEILEIEVLLEAYDASIVDSAVLPDEIGYVRVRRMTSGSSNAFRDAVLELAGQGIDRVVIDLRDNPGGVFGEALRMAELFLPKRAPMLHTLAREGQRKTIVSDNEDSLPTELAMLVDGRTASAAEILVAALRTHGRGLVVGARTFGKSTVEKTFELGNGYRVKFIVGSLYAPAGQSWHKLGIVPDIEVESGAGLADRASKLPMERRLHEDDPLRAAWRLLK